MSKKIHLPPHYFVEFIMYYPGIHKLVLEEMGCRCLTARFVILSAYGEEISQKAHT
jgi:hypothetical protein